MLRRSRESGGTRDCESKVRESLGSGSFFFFRELLVVVGDETAVDCGDGHEEGDFLFGIERV